MSQPAPGCEGGPGAEGGGGGPNAPTNARPARPPCRWLRVGATAAPGPYRGRFAPSPTGPLHAGSLVAALASWLDARAHGGRWLLRIEDVDGPRCPPGTDRVILQQLQACGLLPDEPPVWQSGRGPLYQQALDRLVAAARAYPCGCTRKDIDDSLARQGLGHQRHGERVYPGTCRSGLHGKPARAWRLRCDGVGVGVDAGVGVGDGPDGPDLCVSWTDRRLGPQQQNLTAEVGDIVLRRADGLWAYQLAVVVDDAAQGITHVVRGEDLADNTPRQLWLQHLLAQGHDTEAQAGAEAGHSPAAGLHPAWLHTPLVLAPDGQKLSKQNGAAPLDLADPVRALRDAAAVLGLPALPGHSRAELLAAAVQAWPWR